MAPATTGRHVDALDPLPDEQLKKQDQAYLDRFQVDKLFGEMLHNIVTDQPPDPVQYIIDFITYTPEYAKQDPATGLPEHRKAKLLDLFRVIDKDNTGKISFKMLQQYTNKYGGYTMGADELTSIFADFKPGSDNLITQEEFIVFFSRVSRTITNAAFDALIKDLSS